MGALIEHYRVDAARLRGEFPAAYRRVKGKAWKDLAKRMEARAARAEAAAGRGRPGAPARRVAKRVPPGPGSIDSLPASG
jgi:hypothetical protein